MKSLEKSQDKIEQICEKLRYEAIEPSKKEAQQILLQAKKEEELLLLEAHKQASRIIEDAKNEAQQIQQLLQSSLEQSSKQALEVLRQSVEKLFNKELEQILAKQFNQPEVIANFFNVLISAIEKEGLHANLEGVVSKSISSKEVIALLISEVKNKLKNSALTIGDFSGGLQLKLLDQKMTIDLSDKVLKDLLAQHIQKDFRQFIFSH